MSESTVELDGNIVEGYLLKRTLLFWKRKWFTIGVSALYSKQMPGSEVQSWIPFLATARVVRNESNKRRFCVISGTATWKLEAESTSLAEKWANAIETAIMLNNQASRDLRALSAPAPNLRINLNINSDYGQENNPLKKSSSSGNLANQLLDDDGGSDDACVVCYENVIDTVYLPCAHFAICYQCATQIAQCPICRAYCTKKIKVFRA